MQHGYINCKPLAQEEGTSTGTGSPVTISAPTGARACLVTVKTNDAYVTLDGSTPAANNGLLLKAGVSPVYLPVGHDLQVASSQAGASSVVDVAWLG